MAYLPNPGRIPAECQICDEAGEVTGWRRVHIRLFGGWDSRKAGHDPWPAADGRPATVWRVSRPPHTFEIKEWEIA
jgi:hypothetical protein